MGIAAAYNELAAGGAVLRGLLVPLASRAPARVFVLEGLDPPAPPDMLRLFDSLVLVDSPRSANILLVAGTLPPSLHGAALRVHDELSQPRCVIHWRSDADAAAPFATAIATACTTDVLPALLARVHRELLETRQTSAAALLPNADPAPWRGVGPYGQGGAGMTGGVPYGRRMPETAPDRDGLALDQLKASIGPFFPPFPTGLTLDVALQGDLIQECSVKENPFEKAQHDRARATHKDDPFLTALTEPVPIATLEMARARHHLQWLAHALRVHGLPALGRRVLAFGQSVQPADAALLRPLQRSLERAFSFAFLGITPAVTSRDEVRDRGLGPVARAAGLPEDARTSDSAYTALGFSPIVQEHGDVAARWRQRLAESMQSVELASRAGEARTGGTGLVESVRGPLTNDAKPMNALLTLLPGLLRGLEWGDAVSTVVSLDLDLRVQT